MEEYYSCKCEYKYNKQQKHKCQQDDDAGLARRGAERGGGGGGS